MIRRGLLVAGLVCSLAGVAASGAHASDWPVRDCGSPSPYLRNVTARALTCADARNLASKSFPGGFGTLTARRTFRNRLTGKPFTYLCHQRPTGHGWWLDVRCTYRFYVYRFQAMSGE